MGKLLAQGLEMKEVIDLMRHTTNYPLMKELAGAISEGLLVGETLHRQLALILFTKALGLMIQQGEVKGKLGKELMVYSNVCFQGFSKIERVITLVQPLIFIIIACLIIGVYGAMLFAYLWQYGRSFIMKKKQKYAGFTLLEMLIVLLIISVLILLLSLT